MERNSREVEERLLSSPTSLDHEDFHTPAKEYRRKTHLRRWTMANFLFSVLLVGLFVTNTLLSTPHINELLIATSFYSPVLQQREIKTFTHQIDGGIASNKTANIGRIPPGPMADAAWSRFESIRTVPISKTDIIRLQKDPETAARFPESQWQMGGDAYMGQLDVVHHIHCLNQLRKRAFYTDPRNPDRNSSKATMERPEWYWVHLQHCVSVLLEVLMCNANTDVLTLNWIEEADYPMPDFSVNKKCHDFEAVMSWQEDNAVSLEDMKRMKKPKDGEAGRILKGEREWWTLDGVQVGHDHS